MSHRPTRRLVRAAAGATAGVVLGATALVAATPAAAAGSGSPILYRATTGTGVVQLVLTLPSTAPGFPNPAVLTLIGTDGQGLHSAGTPDVARTDSFLAGGSLITGTPLSAGLSPLGRILTADLAHPHPTAPQALTFPSNPLGLVLEGGTQTANVQPTTSSAASSRLAKASLVSLDALGLGRVLDPASTQLTAALDQLTTALQPLDAAADKLPTAPVVTVQNPLQPITGGLATMSTPRNVSGKTLVTEINTLPGQVTALLKKLRMGAVLQLDGLDTLQGISPAASSATATGRTNLADVQLFGGLVIVRASKATATATAGLTKSAASSSASATLVEVTVSDDFATLLKVVASDRGITARLLAGSPAGTALDTAVQPAVMAANAALDALFKQLTGLLANLNSGAKLLRQGTATHTVSPDGRTAQAHAVPAQVTLGLPGATNLLQVSIGRADAVVAVATPVAPAAPVAAGAVLPRTGLEQGGTVAAALLLVSGLGLVAVRRRRLSA